MNISTIFRKATTSYTTTRLESVNKIENATITRLHTTSNLVTYV